MRDWRKIGIGAGVALAMLLMWIFRAERSTDAVRDAGVAREAATVASELSRQPPSLPMATASLAPIFSPTAGTPSPPLSPPTATPVPATPANLAAIAAEDYRRRAEYPRWSTPIEPGSEDPIARERLVSANISRGPNGEDPALVSFPEEVSFETPSAVTLYAYLTVNEQRVPAARIEGEVKSASGEVVERLSFNDDGRYGDGSRNDSIFTARLESERAQPLRGAYAVNVHAVTMSGDDRYGATGFLYSHPASQLTGHYRDSLVDGNLRIECELDVKAAGRFHLEATLYAAEGMPLVWAQNAAELDRGLQSLPLTFFGRALHQKGIAGPYVLRYVALSTTTDMPNAKNQVVENAYTTGPYRPDQFSDRPFDDPDLLESARRLENAGAGAP